MVGDVRLPTKVVSGCFVLTLLLAVVLSSRALSTTLPRFSYLIVAMVILFVLSTLLLAADLLSG